MRLLMLLLIVGVLLAPTVLAEELYGPVQYEGESGGICDAPSVRLVGIMIVSVVILVGIIISCSCFNKRKKKKVKNENCNIHKNLND